jgi:hypothetical protein
MQTRRRKLPIVAMALLILAALFGPPGPVGGAPILNTDKDVYHYGETIKVSFSNSPGNEGDWICIVPAGSPDTEGGDYQYMPKGVGQGTLVFDPPAPGKYEARAYYNYERNGYVVSGRYAFTVMGGPGAEVNLPERKANPSNPLEANLSPGKGLVYLFRESSFVSSSYEVQVIANGSPIVFMRNASYFLLEVPAGDVALASGIIRNNFPNTASAESIRECKATLHVKSGYVYYVRLRMIPVPFWAVYLDPVPHAEGANTISGYKLSRIEK